MNVPGLELLSNYVIDDQDPEHYVVYRLGRVLGKGAHGRVQQAQQLLETFRKDDIFENKRAFRQYLVEQFSQERTHRTVAIKFSFLREETSLRRIHSELSIFRVLNRLPRNDNLLRFYSAFAVTLPDERGEPAKQICIVTNAVHGANSNDFVSTLNKTETNTAFFMPILYNMTRQLLATTHFLNSNGIWHGDIKPNNILIGSDMRLTLLDYGFSCFPDQEQWLSTKNRHELLDAVNECDKRTHGTAHYIAPELFRADGQPRGMADASLADAFAVGVTLFGWATNGRWPFADKPPSSKDVREFWAATDRMVRWDYTTSKPRRQLPRLFKRLVENLCAPNVRERWDCSYALRYWDETLSRALVETSQVYSEQTNTNSSVEDADDDGEDGSNMEEDGDDDDDDEKSISGTPPQIVRETHPHMQGLPMTAPMQASNKQHLPIRKRHLYGE